ncbi:MAG: LPS export ABC transporter periplasmic protein LptC [Niabella sp.]
MKKLFVLLSIVSLCACENNESEINALNKKAVQKDEAIKVESFLSQGGITKARLTAPLMLRVGADNGRDTPYVEFPRSLHVDFYDTTKTVTSRLDSKYGKYFESLDKVYLKDSVRVVSSKGDTLFCHDLWWDQHKELFYTDLPALLKSPGRYIPAKNGLEATQDFKRISFKAAQEGQLVTEEDAIPKGGAGAQPDTPVQPARPDTLPGHADTLQ